MGRARVVTDLVNYVTEELYARSDKKKARQMAAYMKTEMPFYGVQRTPLRDIGKGLREFPLTSRAQYVSAVSALWKLEHREEKYLAITLARQYPQYVDRESIPLYRRMIEEGAWWDFVDEIAVHLVGDVYLNNRRPMAELMDEWVDDAHMWIRRTAILSQNRHKEQTDYRRLFRYCKRRAHEKEFFIRKAIGWALRSYSYTEPQRVRAFLLENRSTLSGLSFREGAKVLIRKGLMEKDPK